MVLINVPFVTPTKMKSNNKSLNLMTLEFIHGKNIHQQNSPTVSTVSFLATNKVTILCQSKYYLNFFPRRVINNCSLNSHAVPLKTHAVPLKTHTVSLNSHAVPLKTYTVSLNSHAVPLKTHTVFPNVHTFFPNVYAVPLKRHALLLKTYTVLV